VGAGFVPAIEQKQRKKKLHTNLRFLFENPGSLSVWWSGTDVS